MKTKIQLNLLNYEVSQEIYYYYLLNIKDVESKFYDLKNLKIPVCHVSKNENTIQCKEIIENELFHKMKFEIKQDNNAEMKIGNCLINFKILEKGTSKIISLVFNFNNKTIKPFIILEKKEEKEEKNIEEEEKENKKRDRLMDNDKRKDKNKEKENDKNKEKENDKKKDKNKEKDNDKNKEKDNDKNKEKENDKNKEKDKDKNKEKENDKNKEKDKDKNKEKDDDKNKDKNKEKDKDKNKEKDKDKNKEKDKDKNNKKDDEKDFSTLNDKKNDIKNDASISNMSIDNNSNSKKNKLLKSKIGLINPSATCYMASILQALIHSEKFLDYFFKNKKGNYCLSRILDKLFNQIETTKEKRIPLKDFASDYNKIDNRYHFSKGNTPSCFLNHILENLNNEIEGISDLFHGKIKISFKKNKEFNTEQDFLVYPKNFNNDLKSELFCPEQQEINGRIDEVSEELIIFPSILVINGYPQSSFKISENLYLKKEHYKLYAVNEYNDVHSIM